MTSGRALETFARIIEAQGGNPKVVDDPGVLPQAAGGRGVPAPTARASSRRSSHAASAGRSSSWAAAAPRSRTSVDPTVGFVDHGASRAIAVRAGEPIASVFARDEAGIAVGMQALKEAVTVGETGKLTPLVSHRITARGVEVLADGF